MCTLPFGGLGLVLALAGRPGEATSHVREDPTIQDRITAYVAPVRSVLALDADPKADDEVRKTARDWIELARRGVLTDLEAADCGDTCQFGVKQEVMRAKCDLAQRLAHVAERASTPQQATRDALDVLRLATVGKYSDLHAVAAQYLRAQAAVEIVARTLRKLAPDEAAATRRELATMIPDLRECGRLLLRGWTQVSLERPEATEEAVRRHDIAALVAEMATETASRDDFVRLQNGLRIGLEDHVGLLHIARMAYKREIDLAKRLRELAGG